MVWEFAPDAMLVVAPDGRIAAANRQIEHLLGYAPSEVEGRPIEILVPARVRATHAGKVAGWFRLPTTRGMGSGLELRAQHRDGHELEVDVSLGPLRTASGLKAVVAIRDASARRAHERDLAWRATHDPLTGLCNRAMLLDHLRAALLRNQRHPNAVGVLYVDLDGFKAVNDRLGHEVGDEVLRAAADSIRHGVRAGDVVGRIGGDEFVVVCEELRGLPCLQAIAHRVQTAVRGATVRVSTGRMPLACSIGLALAAHAETDPEHILRRADAAMYRAKLGGDPTRCATAEHDDAR